MYWLYLYYIKINILLIKIAGSILQIQAMIYTLLYFLLYFY